MSVKRKAISTVGVGFFLMGSLLHAQTTDSKDTISTEKKIEEVVVVGYKQQRKETLTSSVTTVSAEKLQDVTSSNFQTMLQGKMPGVVAAVSAGKPGSSPVMRIRGVSSIAANQNPLYVVDGVIIHSDADVPPDQIENVTILKDAAATALYGSRGASGVVVITTKSGRGNSVSLSVNNTFNFYNMGNFKLMNSQQQKERFLEFAANGTDIFSMLNKQYTTQSGMTPITSLDQITRDFDWLDLATKVGVVNNYNLSLNKSSDGNRTYFNAGYYKEEGTVKGYKLERFSAKLNQESKIYDWLKFSPKLTFTFDQVYDQEYSLYAGMYNMPWDSPFYPDGSIYDVRSSNTLPWFSRDRGNYLLDRPKSYGKNNTFNGQGNLDFEVRLAKNLKFISTNSLTYYNYDGLGYSDPSMLSQATNKGQLSQSNAIRWTKYTNQMLKYENTWNDVHKFNALVAYEYQDYMYKSNGATVKGLVVGSEVLSNGAEALGVPNGQKNEYAFQSYLSNAEYSYADKYLLQGSVRIDQSSRFPKQHKTGLFWAVSAGWNISNENFFESLSGTINKWKIRGSYGVQGNAPTDYYVNFNRSSSRPYNGLVGLFPSAFGNTGLKWETIYQLDLGTDISFLNNRINVTFDWYNKETKDLITNLQLPIVTGYTSQVVNFGTLRNRGIEFSIDADVIKKSDFKWNIGFNFAKNKSTLVELANENYKSGQFRYTVGEQIYTYDLREWAGVDAANGNPLWTMYYIDKDGNGAYNTGDTRVASLSDYQTANPDAVIAKTTTTTYSNATYINFKDKSRLPDFTGGISTALSYKGFTLAAQATFSKGGYLYNAMRQNFTDNDGIYPFYNQMVLTKDWSRWSVNNTPEQNANATHPSLVYEDKRQSNGESTRYLEDASFFKIRSISLSYDLPKQFLPANNMIKSLRLSVNLENMFMFTKFSGFSPEMGYTGNNSGGSNYSYVNYPAPKGASIGLNATF